MGCRTEEDKRNAADAIDCMRLAPYGSLLFLCMLCC